MSRRDGPFSECAGGVSIQVVEAKEISDSRSVKADPSRQILLRERELMHELLQPMSAFHWIQVLPLDILDQC